MSDEFWKNLPAIITALLAGIVTLIPALIAWKKATTAVQKADAVKEQADVTSADVIEMQKSVFNLTHKIE